MDHREARSATAPAPEQPAAAGLDDRARAVLDFERDWTRHAGAKEEAIRQAFGLSATRYYQLLGALIETRPALAYDPLLVGRLLRLRETRAAARAARALPAGLPDRPTAR
ncbi:hypothetical protein BFL36_09585 [Clavibacter michiganensis]|uniref:DUF3263 domain-containing protein n=1 Tax=Clavibacter michiganensis TaxID=28447 RepID=A0A251YEP0_9MICO|nr:DUF3263 domain-containing protein [Clavibacter michiganensis]OUE22724.1 hypothetical protein BFL36_09585 [Clavibacter michiganensis]